MKINKSNGMLKLLLVIFLGLVAAVIVIFSRGKSEKSISTTPEGVVYDVTKQEQQELGIIAGDTPHDTLKTLVGTLKKSVRILKKPMMKMSGLNVKIKR
ncbi:hypothetical protein [Avibacterium sp. 21-599]|uniref:hypothetical protein n=1 Tax=Avibacterium sp. 21-599 TaxID=2911528 RepID=UPI002246A4B9|nr:hypothetical protein [Avibacterium sp. 21-599]MCW9718545.1 hypothetical protein [Avibacterium sp. 21-599]